jgi:hypothetical protein
MQVRHRLVTGVTVAAAALAAADPSFAVQKPSPPARLTVVDATATTITVVWSASARAQGYRVYRDNVRVATTTATRYRFTGLACGHAYRLGVEAFNGGGTSPRVTINAVTDPCAPGMPTNLRATVTASTITLLWNPSSGASGYRTYLDGAAAATTTGTSYTFAGLSCGTSYRIAVEAYNGGGASPLASTTALTIACVPVQPANLATTSTATTITLTWSTSAGAEGYRLYSDGALVTTAAVPTTSYTFTGFGCGTNHALAIEAYNSSGTSARATIAASTSACQLAAPAGLSGSATATSIALSWTAVAGADDYLLYLNGAQVATATSASYTFANLTCGTSYTLEVAAHNAVATSARGSLVIATASCRPPSAGVEGVDISISSVAAADPATVTIGGCNRPTSGFSGSWIAPSPMPPATNTMSLGGATASPAGWRLNQTENLGFGTGGANVSFYAYWFDGSATAFTGHLGLVSGHLDLRTPTGDLVQASFGTSAGGGCGTVATEASPIGPALDLAFYAQPVASPGTVTAAGCIYVAVGSFSARMLVSDSEVVSGPPPTVQCSGGRIQ